MSSFVFLSGKNNELFLGLTSNSHFSGLGNSTCHFLTVSLFHITHDDIKPCANMNLPLSSLLYEMMPFTIQIKPEPWVTARKLLFINFFMLSCNHAVAFSNVLISIINFAF